MIEICNLTKKYAANAAVKDISFTIRNGEIVGFLGPNGAGKSTTMNILTGYISYNEGSVKVGGYDILESPFEAKRKIGYLPEQPPLYPDMTVSDYLEFVFELKKASGNKSEHIRGIMEQVGILDVEKRLIKHLSKGYRQRVGLAQALIGDPEILILDEPTVGLDPKQIIEMREFIRSLGGKHTIILSSHIMQEVSAVCDRVLIIDKGRIIASGTPEELSEALTVKPIVMVQVAADAERVRSALSEMETIDSLTVNEEDGVSSCEIEFTSGDVNPGRAVAEALAKSQLPVLKIDEKSLTLEDVFLELTAEGAEAYTTEENALTDGTLAEDEEVIVEEIVEEAVSQEIQEGSDEDDSDI